MDEIHTDLKLMIEDNNKLLVRIYDAINLRETSIAKNYSDLNEMKSESSTKSQSQVIMIENKSYDKTESAVKKLS